MPNFILLPKTSTYKNALSCIFICLLSFFWSCGLNSSKTAAPQVGYYYSIVFDPVQKKAQYSTVYFSECEANVLDAKTKEYAKGHSYSDFKVQGKFADTKAALDASNESKKQYEASGYTIGGDNNFFGDCQL